MPLAVDWLNRTLNARLARDTRLRFLPFGQRDCRNRVCVIRALRSVFSSPLRLTEASLHLSDADLRPFVNKELFLRGLAVLLCVPSTPSAWKPSHNACGYAFHCGDSAFRFSGVPGLEWRFSHTRGVTPPVDRPLPIKAFSLRRPDVPLPGRRHHGLGGPELLHGHPQPARPRRQDVHPQLQVR